MAVGIVVVPIVLGLPVLSAQKGGYSLVQGLFIPTYVPNVAVIGTACSNLLLLVGVLGLLAGLVWPALSVWTGGISRTRVVLAYGALITLGIFCRIETAALVRYVFARDNRAVKALYAEVHAGTTIGQLKALAARYSPDIRIRYSSLSSYDMLRAENDRHDPCTVEYSSPGRYSGTRLVAEVSECGGKPGARLARIYLVDHKKKVGQKGGGI
ncbi:hypothetical protein GCM10027285_10100 [Oleiagrimonas citrea]